MSMFRKFVSVGGQRIEITAHSDDLPAEPPEKFSRVHVGCGGNVVNDADFIANGGDEIWWNYRCEGCGETFRDPSEWR